MNAELSQILEAALFASGSSLTLDEMQSLFSEIEKPNKTQLQHALTELQQSYDSRGIELVEFGGKWRLQTKLATAPYVANLWQEKPTRYSRALLETLAIIAFKQPVTRAEIEQVRGVSVSSQIVQSLLERNWVKIVGQKEVPGRPNLYGTTADFLSYFNLHHLAQLPTANELEQRFKEPEVEEVSTQASFEKLLSRLKEQEAEQDEQFEQLQQSLEDDFAALDAVNKKAEAALKPVEEDEAVEEDVQVSELKSTAEALHLPKETNEELSSESKDEIIAQMLAQQAALLKQNDS